MSNTNKNSQIICRNNKFGYCKFADKCKYQHVESLCEEKLCEINNCEKRHPKICIYQRDYGRCKTSFCKYYHGNETNIISNLEEKLEISRKNNKELEKRIELPVLENIVEEKDQVATSLANSLTKLEKQIDLLKKAAVDKDQVVILLANNLTKVVDTLNQNPKS